ncbi:hypothetical protein OOZ63_09215 [Paucibacter sp. PLA-PC-4]|uniref:hypothetical protein n=1 Tax=Paucibacter sp. PLA-PC-4 TaxID=2993655 RepID=UPI002248AF0F|nr:hypothetical protein [Paucibacter sp. PLA-PC-4]MCX2862018.1 hypothetical protein [Paucibacter sp. PLA-PC-4]
MTIKVVGVVGLALLLGACGGGGGAADPAPPPVVPPVSASCEPGSVARLAREVTIQAGRATELALLACGGSALAEPRWQQTAGPGLALLSARSPALSIEPTLPGSYRLTLSFRDARAASHTAELALEVAPAAAGPSLSVRGEPSVWGGGSLSLRAWAPGLSSSELAGAQWYWEQLDGPAATLERRDSARLVFKAPAVSVDSLLRLRAQLNLADGRSASDEFTLLVQPPPQPAANPLFDGDNPASRVYPWLSDGPHARALSDCIYHPGLSSSPNNLCTLARLPLLGQQTAGAVPTVEQVMQRLLVSNDWMAEVFERFLREEDPHGDFRRMLNASTAVVIGARVRPAFYWGATGAIYLDGAYLWMTPEQLDTLSESPDPRSAYGAALAYSTPWRYVLDNRHAIPAYPVAERPTRTLAALRYELARLLYHELAHAADFVPPRVQIGLGGALRVYEASPALTASQDLHQRYPFFSQEMRALGQVLFFGTEASAQQKAYRPEDIVHFFSQDRVSDDYSYSVPAGQSVPREDAAMLVEEAMMQLRYGVLRDTAIAPQLAADAGSSADLPVVWGQRGRIGEAALRPRVRLVLADLLPWLEADAADRLASPLLLKPGLTWGENLDQAAIAAGRPAALNGAQRLAEQAQGARQARERESRVRAQALHKRLDLQR